MIPSDQRTRRRPIKACVECYRRKQRCDRGRPCNVCTSRKVPERCIYSEFHPTSHSVNSDDGSQANASDSQSTLSTEEAGYSQQVCPLGFLAKDMVFKRTTNTTGAAESAYFDLIAQLPPPGIVQELIDIYFKEADWFFGLLERYYFDRWRSSWQTSKARLDEGGSISAVSSEILHFSALLFQLLAVALHFLPPNASCVNTLQLWHTSARDRLSGRYSENAMRIMSTLGRDNPTLPSVLQGHLRALWLKNSSRGKEAWYAVGSTIRQAQDLGLHLEPESSRNVDLAANEQLTRAWYEEFKRRVWSRIFSWDSHMSISFGRPRAVHILDCTVRAPVEADFPDDPASTELVCPGPYDAPSSYTPHRVQHIIGERIHRAMSAGVHRPGTTDYDTVMSFHHEVSTLLETLHPAMNPFTPDKSWDDSVPHLQEKRLQITINCNSFLLALHRHHIRDQPFSRAAAVNAALMILTAQQRLYEIFINMEYKMYMLSYYTVECSLLLVATRLSIANWDPHFAQQIDEALQSSVLRLSWMARRSKLAETGLNALNKSLAKLRRETPSGAASMYASTDTMEGIPSVAGSSDSCNAPAEYFHDPVLGRENENVYHQQDPSLFPPITEADAIMFAHQSGDDLDALMAVTDPDYTLENLLSRHP